jgi:hypothetical protein
MSMSEGPTTPTGKRTAEKKMAAQRAAKFREETPRKGGGLAIKDRDTALQQYAGSTLCTQVRKDTLPNFPPTKT